jgi:gamma-glutamyltranspeptidase
MLWDLFSLGRGADLFVSEGRMLREGETLDQTGLVQTLEMLAEEVAASVYSGSLE